MTTEKPRISGLCLYAPDCARRVQLRDLLAVGYFLTRQPGVFRQGAAGVALGRFSPVHPRTPRYGDPQVFAFHDNPLSWVDTQFPMLLSCNDCNCSSTACGFLQTCYLLRMNPQSWAEEQASRIAAEIKRLRRGINDAPRSGLRDRTTELGYSVTRPVIADLETAGGSTLTTAELMVLGARSEQNADRVSCSLRPLEGDSIEVLPGFSGSKTFALQWFSGEADNPFPEICDDPRRVSRQPRAGTGGTQRSPNSKCKSSR